MTEIPTKILVINEWLIHDLQGDNTEESRTRTYRFLQEFEQERDKLAVLKGGPWMQKIYGLMRSNDIQTKVYSTLIQRIVMDSGKCSFLQPDDVAEAAPQDAIDAAPEEDIYLIQTYYASNADLLITTDEGLYQAFEARQDVEVIYRDAFLNDYLNS